MIEALFMHMFDGLATRCASDLAHIAAQYPFEPLVAKPTRITFAEGIKMLQDNGWVAGQASGLGRPMPDSLQPPH